MVGKQSDQSALLDAIYSFAIEPDDYLEFTEIWDSTILRRVESDSSTSLRETAESLELHRHFGRALEVHEKTRLSKRQSIQSFLDRQTFASATCDHAGQISACNPAFVDHLGLSVGDSLAALSDKIEPLTGSGSRLKGKTWWVGGSDQSAFRYYERDKTKSLVIVEALEDTAGQKADQRYLVRTTKIEWSARVSDFLRKAFNLTVAETEIAAALVEGHRSNMIASLRGSKTGTVRQQIKSIMEKCRSRSQSELMAMLVNLQHLLVAKRFVEEKRTVQQSSETKIHETRIAHSELWGNLDYEMYGAPNGRPVAFFHCQYSSARPTQNMIDAMAMADLLVFAPRKPGLGETSMERQETDPVGFVAAMVQVMHAAGYSPHALIGHGMSGVAVIDYAVKNPTYRGALVALNSGVPFTDREQFEHMPPVPKRVLWTVWDCPELFYAPFCFASESMQANDDCEIAFVDDQYKDIPHDRKLIEDPVFYDLARMAMRDFMTTPKRSADDLVYWVHDWTDALLSTSKRLPVLFLQSEHHDFLRYDDTASYVKGVPAVELAELPDTAQLCIFEHPELIASKIAQKLDDNRKAIETVAL